MYFASKVCTFSSGLKNAIKQKKISVLVKSHSKEGFALLKTRAVKTFLVQSLKYG